MDYNRFNIYIDYIICEWNIGDFLCYSRWIGRSKNCCCWMESCESILLFEKKNSFFFLRSCGGVINIFFWNERVSMWIYLDKFFLVIGCIGAIYRIFFIEQFYTSYISCFFATNICTISKINIRDTFRYFRKVSNALCNRYRCSCGFYR